VNEVKVMGVDLGGTKIKIGVLDQSGNVIETYLYPTETPIYENLEKSIRKVLLIHPEIEGIGIGTPGFVDRKNGIIIFASENLPGWTGTKLKEKLENDLKKLVIVENDANVAALAEVKSGVAIGYKNVLMLTLGTGVGGGVIVEGEILYGPNGAAGEFGHMLLYPEGIECNCGRKGCQEQYISGQSLKRRIREANIDFTPDELMKAKAFDPSAEKIVNDFTYDLALSILSLQAAFDMEILVLGGGVSDSAEYWLKELNQHLKKILFHPLTIEVGKLKNDAGMIGAAQLVLNEKRKAIKI
jgi:glucokinase